MDFHRSLSGKTALVTGASQGLGRTLALALAVEGCRVAVNHLGSEGAAAEVTADIAASGGVAQAFEADIADEKQVGALFDRVGSAMGSVDILINNARMDPYRRLPEMSEGQWWDMVMAVNLKGAFLCSWKFMEGVSSRNWGRIVNISSVRSFLPAEPSMIAYGVSKLGMHGLTRAFAEWGAGHGITANSVAPGMIVTENIHKRLSPEMYARELSRIPVKRGATMEEIANAVLFVLKNGYVTGETLNINGGMHYAP